MNISREIPQIYWKCREKFGVDFDRGIIITYGDTVYCKFDLPLQKIVHEAVHVKQQTAMGPEIWWEKYFEFPAFRLSQEMAAYLEEAKFLKQSIKDRNQRFNAIRRIALDLSGPIYGNVISYNEAFKLLNK